MFSSAFLTSEHRLLKYGLPRVPKCSRNDCTWHLVLWGSWLGHDESKAGLNDLDGLFQPKGFSDSVVHPAVY